MIGDPKQKPSSRRSQFAMGRPSAREQADSLGEVIDVPQPDFQGLMNQKFVAGQEKKDKELTKELDIDFYTTMIKDSVVPKQTIDRAYKGTGDLLDLIDNYEGFGGSDYSLLWNNSHKEGGKFAGKDVSNMTIDELVDFTKPSGEYGQYVKSTNPEGVVGTPLGRYNIVGTTLKDVAKNMGLPGDTKFTKEVQDEMFLFLVDRRLKKAKGNKKRMLEEIRNEFAGFKKVPDDNLYSALDTFRMSPRPKYKPKGLGER